MSLIYSPDFVRSYYAYKHQFDKFREMILLYSTNMWFKQQDLTCCFVLMKKMFYDYDHSSLPTGISNLFQKNSNGSGGKTVARTPEGESFLQRSTRCFFLKF